MRVHNGHVLGATALIAPAAAVFVPLGLAPLLSLVAVTVLGVAWRGERLHELLPRGPLVLFGALLLWSAASLLWTVSVPAGLDKLPRLAGLIASGVVVAAAGAALNDAERRAFRRLLVAGVGIGFAVLAFERATGGAIQHFAGQHWDTGPNLLTRLNRGATVLALVIWPAIVPLFRWRAGAALLAIAAVFALLMTLKSNAALFGFAIGAVAFAAMRIGPRHTPRLIAALAIFYIVASPVVHAMFLTPQQLRIDRDAVVTGDSLLPRSSYHRLLIWNFTAERILERPLLGWGIDSARAIPGGDVMLDTAEPALPLHPHNGPLQLWLELGAGGALLAVGLVVLLMRRVRAWPVGGTSPEAAAALFATGFVIVSVSYGLWQSWWLAALFLAGAFCAAARVPAEAPTAEAAVSRVPEASPELRRH
jgi:exopolysaccharide production protein ExoQ